MHLGHEEVDMARRRRFSADEGRVDAARGRDEGDRRAAAADGHGIARVHQSASSALTWMPLRVRRRRVRRPRGPRSRSPTVPAAAPPRRGSRSRPRRGAWCGPRRWSMGARPAAVTSSRRKPAPSRSVKRRLRIAVGCVELHPPAGLVLRPRLGKGAVEVLAGDVAVLDDQAREGAGRRDHHHDVDGDDRAEEEEHDREHVPPGEGVVVVEAEETADTHSLASRRVEVGGGAPASPSRRDRGP